MILLSNKVPAMDIIAEHRFITENRNIYEYLLQGFDDMNRIKLCQMHNDTQSLQALVQHGNVTKTDIDLVERNDATVRVRRIKRTINHVDGVIPERNGMRVNNGVQPPVPSSNNMAFTLGAPPNFIVASDNVTAPGDLNLGQETYGTMQL